ncbi:MAG: ATP-binding protein [Niabella sp.]
MFARKTRKRDFWEWMLLGIALVLFVGSFFIGRLQWDTASLKHETRLAEKYISQNRERFLQLIDDKNAVQKLMRSREEKVAEKAFYDHPFSLYIYRENTAGRKYLWFWSSANVLPDTNTIYGEDGETFIKLPNGYYYVIKKPLKDYPGASAICLILVKYSFFIETKQLVNKFAFSNNLHKKADVSFMPTEFPVKVGEDGPTFYMKQRGGAAISDTVLAISLRVIGILLIFITIYFILYKRYAVRRYALDILLFLSTMILFRIVLYLFSDWFRLNNFPLFDPKVYASGILFPSLGDLCITAFMFLCTVYFVWRKLEPRSLSGLSKIERNKQWLIAGAWIFALTFLTYFVVRTLRGLITDSKISFDVTNFFSLTLYTAIGFMVIACVCLGYHYFSRIAFKYIFSVFKRKELTVYGLIILSSVFCGLLIGSRESFVFYILCFLWLLIYTYVFREEGFIGRFVKFNISAILFWIFYFSVSVALLMLKEVRRAEISERKSYVEKLASQTDESSDRLIGIAHKYLDSTFFRENFRRFYDAVQSKAIRDSISEENYIGYLNKYETSLYVFDSSGAGLYNPTSLSLESLNTTIERQSQPTSIPDLYMYGISYDKFAYINHRIVKDSTGNVIGRVFIMSYPKEYMGSVIHPELFKDFNMWDIANSSVYQYAIYNNNYLVSSSKKYSFTTSLHQSQIPKLRMEMREKNGYSELWYRPGNGIVVVMVRRDQTFVELITLFSYVFCGFLILVLLFNVVTLLLTWLQRRRKLPKRLTLFRTIRGQIYATFVMITLLSFALLAFTTISSFIDRYENNNRDKMSRTMDIMLNEIQSHDNLLNAVHSLSGTSMRVKNVGLDSLVKLVSDIHGVDVNLYDLGGRLRASSQPDVYSKGVLSEQMGPTAYYMLVKLRRVEHVQKEAVSDLVFTSIYSPVRDKQGRIYGFVGIPYFTSEQEINQEISNFLVTVINLNVFIFLITGLVTLLITNRITNSFRVISDKMQQISLARNNEIIVWERDDEIGKLVTEYNKMVEKLAESADMMARSEREEAWREMARQVAHEIKNPLTPMKLSLQYLQKAINEDNPHVQRLAANVANNLVEQIDHLSKIAADFSQFANINQADKQIFDLHEVLHSLHDIYSSYPDLSFIWERLKEDVHVFADRTHMNRLFTNLFVNAIDAMQSNVLGILRVSETLSKGNIIISVTDNGEGIKEDMCSKIFTPNFTTKSSGTGLGLAMCKSIVENSGGKIWFDTEVGVGTTFYVQLPLVE